MPTVMAATCSGLYRPRLESPLSGLAGALNTSCAGTLWNSAKAPLVGSAGFDAWIMPKTVSPTRKSGRKPEAPGSMSAMVPAKSVPMIAPWVGKKEPIL